eukprot:CAMPEP_0181256590 /NCGR_PEP_ID=MMETSP1096-20121128/49795_1 /TAXON_ID=156174 ORGANISM="Chrysochromulina ericina, Strain CCMP281" /NCGR_SAMPLE_ID=MMETSP1096 /ASSEMBLY_ACC=CAM_ASM_000453 /LENGTH=42 /DNA_ID= /DNA_START= /DNA_END= /DNA_ORIENTATION=
MATEAIYLRVNTAVTPRQMQPAACPVAEQEAVFEADSVRLTH